MRAYSHRPQQAALRGGTPAGGKAQHIARGQPRGRRRQRARYMWAEAEQPAEHRGECRETPTAAAARQHGAGCGYQLDEPAQSLSDAPYAVGFWEVADGSANSERQSLGPGSTPGRSFDQVGRGRGRQIGHAAHTAVPAFMASMVLVDSEVAPSRRTAGRSGFLWRRKASAPPPEPPQEALSWSGAAAATIGRKGRVVAEAAQHTAERGGRVLVNGARDVRQVVAAGVPAPAIEAAGRACVFAGLAAVLLILLQVGSRVLRDRIRGSRDAVADEEEAEAAAQRHVQLKSRFLNALTDSVDRRDAFEPTTYAEILEDYRWMFAQSTDGLDEAGFPAGESRANPMYWNEDMRRTWANFVSTSKSTLVREDAWWDVSDVQQRDRRVDDVDWNA